MTNWQYLILKHRLTYENNYFSFCLKKSKLFKLCILYFKISN